MRRATRDLFDHVVQSSAADMARIALHITRDLHLAEDACQEACFALWRAFAGRADIRDQQAWLRRVVANKAIDAVKARAAHAARHVPLHLAEYLPLPRTDHIADPDQRAVLRAALDQLPPDLRTALTLSLIDRRPYRAVADALGCSESTARRRVREAIRAAESFLEEEKDR